MHLPSTISRPFELLASPWARHRRSAARRAAFDLGSDVLRAGAFDEVKALVAAFGGFCLERGRECCRRCRVAKRSCASRQLTPSATLTRSGPAAHRGQVSEYVLQAAELVCRTQRPDPAAAGVRAARIPRARSRLGDRKTAAPFRKDRALEMGRGITLCNEGTIATGRAARFQCHQRKAWDSTAAAWGRGSRRSPILEAVAHHLQDHNGEVPQDAHRQHDLQFPDIRPTPRPSMTLKPGTCICTGTRSSQPERRERKCSRPVMRSR